jgi:ribosomal protein S18 acetylase RimI-like enzyme
MPLAVRRVKVTDLPVLETLELETTKRFPARTRWVETFRALIETTLSEEPEGLLVADYDGRAIGVAVARVVGPHPLTGQSLGRILVLSVAPGWRTQGIAERLLKEAEASLKSRGCQVIAFSLPSDAGADAELFKQAGFKVASWDLEKV